MLVNCIFVGIGGFAGSVLRYLLSCVIPNSTFPASTLLINVLGSLLLGFLAALALRGSIPNEQVSLMLRVGLCGGFTTFSTFSLESASLLQGGEYGLAIAYAVGSTALCIIAAIVGSLLANALAQSA